MTFKKAGIIFGLVLLLFSGCYKEKLVGEYSLSVEDLQSVPYKISDTVVFITSEDETIILSCNFRGLLKLRENISNNEYIYYEREDTELVSQDYILACMVTTINIEPMLRLKVSKLHDYSGLVWFDLPLEKDNLRTGQAFISEMMIRDKLYTDVFIDSTSWNNYNYSQLLPKTFYYTAQDGILRIDFNNESNWELDTIH